MTDDRINLADLRDRQPDFNLASDTVKWVKEAELLALIEAIDAAHAAIEALDAYASVGGVDLEPLRNALARFDFGGDA